MFGCKIWILAHQKRILIGKMIVIFGVICLLIQGLYIAKGCRLQLIHSTEGTLLDCSIGPLCSALKLGKR